APPRSPPATASGRRCHQLPDPQREPRRRVRAGGDADRPDRLGRSGRLGRDRQVRSGHRADDIRRGGLDPPPRHPPACGARPSRPPPAPPAGRSPAPRLRGARAGLRSAAARLAKFLRDPPGRVALSSAMFALAYAWGAFEAYWICRFLGLPVTVLTALSIETLSLTVDGMLFAVPAKIGTQEGGKVAVFAALGLPTHMGLAF